ncbi:hypothetical protein T03_12747, partial [Trichinella britovi]
LSFGVEVKWCDYFLFSSRILKQEQPFLFIEFHNSYEMKNVTQMATTIDQFCYYMNCNILLLIEKLEDLKLKTEQLTTKKFRLRIIRKVELSRGIKIFKASGEAGDSMLVRRALLIDEDGHRSGRKPLLFALVKRVLFVDRFSLVSEREGSIARIPSFWYRLDKVVLSVRKHPCLDNSNRWSIDIQLLTHWELQTRSTRHRRCLFDKRLSTVWSDAKPCPESSTLTRLC